MFSFAVRLLALLAVANAIIIPTSPDSSTVVKVGDTITALWTADTTGTWTDVEIQLMTGDNYNMIALETLATGIDGTTTTTFSAVAPDVSPNAAIYFLQFSNAGNMTALTWTTRFTIAAADGSTTEPTNSTVYSGTTVEWGTGILLETDANSTTSATSAAASTSSSTGGPTIYTTLSSSTSGTALAAASSGSVSASTTSASAATASTSKSSAGRVAASGVGALIAGFLGVTML